MMTTLMSRSLPLFVGFFAVSLGFIGRGSACTLSPRKVCEAFFQKTEHCTGIKPDPLWGATVDLCIAGIRKLTKMSLQLADFITKDLYLCSQIPNCKDLETCNDLETKYRMNPIFSKLIPSAIKK